MNIDDLIRATLNETAENTDIDKEHKTDLLINVLTDFLKKQLPENKEENEEEK